MVNEIKNTGVRRLSYSKAFDFVCSARPFTPFYCEVAYSVLRAKLLATSYCEGSSMLCLSARAYYVVLLRSL